MTVETLPSAPRSALVLQPSPDINDAELLVLRDTLNPDLNAAELRLFALVAKRSGLDPFARQIYAVKRQGKVTFQTGIDGYRSIAARTGEYDGQDEPVYGPNCTCKDVPQPHPEWATVRVYRKGTERGMGATAYWHEFNPGPGKSGNDDHMWKRMPHNQLAKCAEALALRKAFPYVYADLYTDDEMAQADRVMVTVGPQDGPGGPQQLTELSTSESAVLVDVPAPEGGLMGTIVKVDPPDGFRTVKVKWLGDDEPHRKVEVKFTVERVGKVTAILLDEVADACVEAGLAENDRLWVDDAKIIERIWQEGKPAIKELHNITALKVFLAGAWSDLTAATTAESEDGPRDVTPDSAGSGSGADVEEPIPPSASPAAPLPNLPRLEIADGEVVQGPMRVVKTKWQKRDSDGAEFLVLGLATASHAILGMLDKAEVLAQGVADLVAGETVDVMGAGHAGWLAITAIRRA